MWMIAAPAATPGGTTPAPDLAEVLDEVTVWAKVPLKIEDFVARAMVDNVVLSPGGTRLLVAHMEKATATTTRTPDGVSIRLPTLAGRIPQISLLDFPSMQTVSRQQFPVALGGFSDIRWVNEEQFLLQTDVPASGFSSRRISTGALHAVDVKRAAYVPVSTDPEGLIRNNLPVDLRRWLGVFTSDADGPLRIVAARTGTSHQVLIQTTHD